MKKISILLFLLFAIYQLNAQEDSQTVKIGFVIVSASKNYDATKKLAEKVSKKLGYKLDLRGLTQNETTGLTFSRKECEENNFEYPAYIVRGRDFGGNYVSVEYTNYYKGFTPGYYIIIVSSYEKGNKKLTQALKKTKKYYKNAYIKYSDIYMGCIH